MLLNVTTIEQVRNQAHRSIMPGPLPPNPFTLRTWYKNLGYLMCRPIIPSYIDAPALVKHDNRLPNPGHERSARVTSDGFESFDHHRHNIHLGLGSQQQHEDSSMWKGDSDLSALEMDHVGHRRGAGGAASGGGAVGQRDTDLDSTGNTTRSVWDGD